MLVQQDVFQFEVAVDTGLVVDVRDCADKLRKDLLDFGWFERAVLKEIIIELITCSRVRCAM